MTTSATSRDLALEQLRRRIRTLERNGLEVPPAPLGAAALDAALPGGGLARGAVHEIAPASPTWDEGPAAGFTLAMLGRLLASGTGPALWIASRADLHAPALTAFGVDPARFLAVRARNAADTLWALETALRSLVPAAVTAEVARLDRTASRRLQLAAEAGRTTGLLLLRQEGAQPRRAEPSGAVTRWRIGALPGAPEADPRLLGRPRWRVELLRCRGGRPAEFVVEWNDATGDFALAAPLRDGAADTDGEVDTGGDVGTGGKVEGDSGASRRTG